MKIVWYIILLFLLFIIGVAVQAATYNLLNVDYSYVIWPPILVCMGALTVFNIKPKS
jgi:hypothetical protein